MGAPSGSFWELLGVSWELLRASGSTKEGLQIRLGTLLGLVCSLLAAEDGLGSVVGLHLACFGCSRGPCKGCFGIRQADFDPQNCPSEQWREQVNRNQWSTTSSSPLSSHLVLVLLYRPPGSAAQAVRPLQYHQRHKKSDSGRYHHLLRSTHLKLTLFVDDAHHGESGDRQSRHLILLTNV